MVSEQDAMDASYAPDNDTLAFTRPHADDQNNGNAVYVKSGGAIRKATAALARIISSYAWLQRGKDLLPARMPSCGSSP